LSVKKDSASVRLYQPHDGIEAGRLAGTIGPKEANNFAAVNGEGYVMKYCSPVIGLGD
jgi:hypothetical protein